MEKEYTKEQFEEDIKNSNLELGEPGDEVKKAIAELNRPYLNAVKSGERYLKTPQVDPDNACPNCGSHSYRMLVGGGFARRCSDCGEAYGHKSGRC